MELGASMGQLSRCIAGGLHAIGQADKGRLFSFDTYQDSKLMEAVLPQSQMLSRLADLSDLDLFGDVIDSLGQPFVTARIGRHLLHKARTMSKVFRTGASQLPRPKQKKTRAFSWKRTTTEVRNTSCLEEPFLLYKNVPCQNQSYCAKTGRSSLVLWQAAVLPLDPSGTAIPGLFSEVSEVQWTLLIKMVLFLTTKYLLAGSYSFGMGLSSNCPPCS